MAIGDPVNVRTRLKGLMPPWFGGETPVLDGVLAGLAAGQSWAHDLLRFAKRQMRIATVEGGFIDLLAWDYFGPRFMRRKNEPDDTWRARILPEILRERGTRKGVLQAPRDLTGREAKMLEFTTPGDCGVYGGPYVGYGYAGAWGSIDAHNQCLVTAYRPATTGIPIIPGYGITQTATTYYIAGYGFTGKYAQLSEIAGEITDAMIYATVAETQAAGVIAWTSIQSNPVDPSDRMDFSLAKNSQYL